jgi:hypothetical protein
MARSLIDSFSALVADTATKPVGTERHAAVLGGITPRLMLGLAMLVGAAAGGLLVPALAGPLPADAELVRLLRGMVLIKGAIALTASALLFRRLGRPVTPRPALGYAAGVGLTFGSLGWLWGLSGLLMGSIAFYAGLAIAVFSASRDPLLMDRHCSGDRALPRWLDR